MIDLITAILLAEEDGQRFKCEQFMVTTVTFLVAGLESVNNSFTNLAFALSQVPIVIRPESTFYV